MREHEPREPAGPLGIRDLEMAREYGANLALLAECLGRGDTQLLLTHALQQRVLRAELEHLDAGLRRQHVLGEPLGRELMEGALGVLHRKRDKAEPSVGLQVEPRGHEDATPAATAGRRRQHEQQGRSPAETHAHRRLRGLGTVQGRGGPAAGQDAQLTLSTASMKLSVLVSTHSPDTASTFIVPMRSVLVVTTRPLVGEGLMSRATAMPRRGSYRNNSCERSAVPPGARGVKAKATLGYASAVSVRSSIDASCPAFLSASMNRSSTDRTTVRSRSPHAPGVAPLRPAPV